MISIAIPTSEMKGQGWRFLHQSLTALTTQTYKDFEVVVSDNSDDDRIKEACSVYDELNIRYIRNPIKGMASNTNNAIRESRGDLIKILYLDDYLCRKDSLQDIVDNFTGRWLISGCTTNPHPYYTGDIHQGNNKLGSPSVMTILNKDPLFFDETMTWLLDCDYYKRMYALYGLPVILDKVSVHIGVGDHQATNTLSKELKDRELDYMRNKYENN